MIDREKIYEMFAKKLEMADWDSVDGEKYFVESDIYAALQEALWEVERDEARTAKENS